MGFIERILTLLFPPPEPLTTYARRRFPDVIEAAKKEEKRDAISNQRI